MWPKNPDEFVANHVMPDGADSGDAWYFVFMRGELVCKTVQGAPEPITGDDFRWFEVRYTANTFWVITVAWAALPSAPAVMCLRVMR